ncbi:MAG TPA: hypothetical protein VN802_01475 [Stellaceae bacterium]|nr:hypothetical protein [Stellaceae bacterium]
MEDHTTLTRRAAIAAVAGLTLAASAAEAQERHPKIGAAIRALEAAKADLQRAKHDFGGHREDAVRACDNALEQLRIAERYQGGR